MKRVRTRTVLKVQVAAETDRAAKLLGEHPSVDSVAGTDGELTVTLKTDVSDYSDLPAALIAAGLKLKLFKPEEVNLETAFMELTKGITA